MAQNPEFMAAIGKSFANQTATLSRMVEEDKDEEDMDIVFECATCHFVIAEENMSYSDNTCPHCGSTMYRWDDKWTLKNKIALNFYYLRS